MISNKPSRRAVSKILGYVVDGYNDKRKNFNRIKFMRKLTFVEQAKLMKELPAMFEDYQFEFANFIWRTPSVRYYDGGGLEVTTIKYRLNK